MASLKDDLKKVKSDQPFKNAPVKNYDDYIKDADPEARNPQTGQVKRRE